jgi:hypothetical protein
MHFRHHFFAPAFFALACKDGASLHLHHRHADEGGLKGISTAAGATCRF